MVVKAKYQWAKVMTGRARPASDRFDVLAATDGATLPPLPTTTTALVISAWRDWALLSFRRRITFSTPVNKQIDTCHEKILRPLHQSFHNQTNGVNSSLHLVFILAFRNYHLLHFSSSFKY